MRHSCRERHRPMLDELYQKAGDHPGALPEMKSITSALSQYDEKTLYCLANSIHRFAKSYEQVIARSYARQKSREEGIDMGY